LTNSVAWFKFELIKVLFYDLYMLTRIGQSCLRNLTLRNRKTSLQKLERASFRSRNSLENRGLSTFCSLFNLFGNWGFLSNYWSCGFFCAHSSNSSSLFYFHS